jgi:hypothetical protein
MVDYPIEHCRGESAEPVKMMVLHFSLCDHESQTARRVQSCTRN